MELRRWSRCFLFVSSLTVHVIQKRSSMITLAKEGYCVREIAVKTKIPNSTVHDTMKKLTDTDIFRYKKWTGRPKKSTENADRYKQTLSKRNRSMTATEIAAEVNKYREDSICTTTVKRRLLQERLRGCVAVKKPLLRTRNKKKITLLKIGKRCCGRMSQNLRCLVKNEKSMCVGNKKKN